MNHCIFEGHLTNDPELRYTPNGHQVTSFSIGINKGKDIKPVFPNLEAWGKTAETIIKWFHKGDLIRVYCELVVDTWEDKNSGEKRQRDKFRVDRFDFPPPNKGRSSENDNTGAITKRPTDVKPPASPYKDEEDEIPF